MKDFLKKSNLPTIILSLVLAVSLWATVQLSTDKIRQAIYTNVPVRFEQEDELMTRTGMSVIEGKETTIRVNLEGTGSEVVNLNKNNMSDLLYATVKVGAITEPGRIKVSYDLTVPKDIKVNDRNPKTIEVWVDKIVEREISVQPSVEGEPADTYSYETPEANTRTITISGPESVLDELRYVRAVLTAEGATENVEGVAALVFIDGEGNVVDAAENHISVLSGDVTLSMTVHKEDAVPLRVELKDTEGIPANLITTSVSPESVKLVGDAETIAKLTQEGLLLDTIDIDKDLKADGTKTVTIRLPEGVTLSKGEPKQATVTVTVTGVSEQELEIHNVDIEFSGDPEGWEAEMVADSFDITVRGPSAAVDRLTEDDVRAVVLVDLESLGAGIHSLPLQLELNGADGAAVIEAPTTVSIMLRKTAAEPDAPEQEPVSDEVTQ